MVPRVRRPWYQKRPELLTQVQEDVRTFCTTLHLFTEDNVVWVRGTFPVKHEDDDLDHYALEIRFPEEYPDFLPVVREVGGRIPWTADAHNPEKGACLFLPEEKSEVFPEGSSFLDFLRGPIHNFFLGQSLVALGDRWPFGEHEHGVTAIAAFYQNLFDTKDVQVVGRLLVALAKDQIRGHLDCPCGSGKRVRHCHLTILLNAKKKVSPRMATESIQRWIQLSKLRGDDGLRA